MKDTFAVLHIVKHKSFGSAGASIIHMYRNGPVLNHLINPGAKNIDLLPPLPDGEKRSFSKSFYELMGNDVRIRKNSVLAVEVIVSASPKFFESASEDEIRKWIINSSNWAKDNFGLEKTKDNLFGGVIHYDEKTIHGHYLFCPAVNKDGKLSLNCRAYFHSPTDLSNLQTSYAEAVGLTRGISTRGTTKKQHEDYMHYHNRIAREEAERIANEKLADELLRA